MKLHIYLFRHGQTFDNRNKTFSGWRDSKLTQNGFKDARKVAAKLKSKRIDLAFCSHLSRSRNTLKEVLRSHPECKYAIPDDRIIERCYGKLQGHKHAAFIRQHGQAVFEKYHRSYDIPPPGGESIKMVEKRVLDFIKDLLRMMKKEKVNVAISAHGNSMRPFRRYFERMTTAEMIKLENPWDDYFEYIIDC